MEKEYDPNKYDKIWSYIGEVELEDKDHFNDWLPDGPNRKHFLYKRSLDEGFMFSITSARKKHGAEFCSPTFVEKDYSIFTILTMIVSTELCDFRGNPRHPFRQHKIRLVGMTNWIEYNDDYAHRIINEDDLEKLFESNREG
jgi:hypothetical protein